MTVYGTLAPGPDYNPTTWSRGYQARQFGLGGPDVLAALATPPTSMVNAAGPYLTSTLPAAPASGTDTAAQGQAVEIDPFAPL